MVSQNRRYIFLGPQGSGKGTQAKMLADMLGLPHISTGDIFRAAVDQNTILGHHIATGLSSGKLISDEDTNSLMADRLAAQDAKNGFILDGYPRTMAQLEFLEQLAPPTKIFFLDLSDNEAVKRLVGRLVCSGCENVFHLAHKRPKIKGVCDNCGGELAQRDDDVETAIRERLRLYHKETEPLISFYEKDGRLIRVDGRPDIKTVHKVVSEVLQL
ncbi:hypothetical protein A3E96_00350 [Candidatus Uhrbacteria bacterium RIFCSPHIGHO2_12_FULL_46_13]|uniref:Adenylate kinase n=1 Tax=Candidatus Uhrbacteria bacterium RIFCSPLOWO2_01_FULL_47_25 TaxID=1802402 RepID=A0A1F7UY23_9BACT|nr:MAG: hypothetical protein A2752_04565 [Candidatus Uhrbacteria bacterium RIFCSPHIGHO2_01_FULL_46_23]OGL69715.1 MAG: hypothetical protein A3D60_03465 [Candidatus Uhrbacteria bacterium RIFCSPHIGHO2_02_FULL_47_29]OGL76745.1 MAG: hypothetical protein A3E96_00350 [Candidatus Uhrbacteria bacterium RIFCSPHIGHO2_12_FULL_46_13]OGL82607.1 MAG: hypothetical protein A2936_02255 [Candidatus Uhrbacteria bacterium RIFCSPLOWO2_01_FULL_47_25]OGL86506.1 MAG: hypothetical protein A3I37_01270 [Candidatus Uhrbact